MTEATQNKLRTWFEIIMGVVVFSVLAYFLFIYKKKPVPDPNNAFIQYLEKERQHADSIAGVIQADIDKLFSFAGAREQRDSATLATQNRISEAIKSIQQQYENIPTYRNLSHDSLRRLHATKFGE